MTTDLVRAYVSRQTISWILELLSNGADHSFLENLTRSVVANIDAGGSGYLDESGKRVICLNPDLHVAYLILRSV